MKNYSTKPKIIIKKEPHGIFETNVMRLVNYKFLFDQL